MDLSILKKKLSVYRSDKNRLKNVPDELLLEILAAWELWTGPASNFYTAIGIDFRRMAGFIGRAKKLKQEGYGISEFKEVELENPQHQNNIVNFSPCNGAEVIWGDGKIIRFSQVDLLVEFLKKAA